MNIIIDENFYISVDEKFFTLKEVRYFKGGQIFERTIGVYAYIVEALRSHNIERMKGRGEEVTIAEYNERCKEVGNQMISERMRTAMKSLLLA